MDNHDESQSVIVPSENNSAVNYYSSDAEKSVWKRRKNLFDKSPLPENEILDNLGLFLNSKNLSRMLFFDHIYKQIVDVQGIIVEFGCRWGQNVSLISSLRGIYEPFNRQRKIVAFDTFEGLAGCTEFDVLREGNLSTVTGYEEYLDSIMELQEKDNPLSHIKKYEVIKGNAVETFEKYLLEHPETIVAFAYFDMDIYKPTVECLKLLKSRLVKGSIIGFDELNDPLCPGETIALNEVYGLTNIRLKRYPFTSRVSYFIYE